MSEQPPREVVKWARSADRRLSEGHRSMLIDRQAEPLAQWLERFPGPTTLAVRPELGGEQMGGCREHSRAVLVRPRGEETDECPGSLPASWRE